MARESFVDIYLDLSKQPGKCRVAESGLGWKPAGGSGGQTFTLDKQDIQSASWSRAARGNKKEKRYGPSPSNNYTSGFGKRNFFSRKKKTDPEAGKDSELGTYGAGVAPNTLAAGGNQDLRPSHETGSTAVAPDNGYYDKVDNGGHGNHMPHGAHGGYYTQPQGTGVNPYGYDQPTYTTGTATNY